MLRRLLGEASLERKCRFLFGGGILVLMAGTFIWYSYRMERIVYRGIRDQARLVAGRILTTEHWKRMEHTDFHRNVETLDQHLSPDEVPLHSWRYITPDGQVKLEKGKLPRGADKQPRISGFERRSLASLRKRTDIIDRARVAQGSSNLYLYIRAIRLEPSCTKECHGEARGQPRYLKALLSTKLDMKEPRQAIFWNWAVLMSSGLVIVMLAMGASYLIVRFVVVGPVEHLQEVASEVTAGNLEVRSDIQTGDEFQQFGGAFNRMLEHLQSSQEELRRANVALDAKFDELAQANMALYEMNRLKSEFLSTVTHELRTPLNSILGFSDVLLEGGFGTLGDRQRRYVDNIRSSGGQLLNMINDVLDLSKIDSGQMEISVSEFSFYDLAEGLLVTWREMASRKQLSVEGDVKPGIPILRTDRVKLQQVLQNLLSNAVKFTPEGGRVKLAAHVENDQLVVAVSDTGEGISETDQQIVFEKFRQGDSGLTRQTDGTGLGLSIAKELCRLLGGTVAVASTLGRGSTFTVRLPAHLADQQQQYVVPVQSAIDLSKARRITGSPTAREP